MILPSETSDGSQKFRPYIRKDKLSPRNINAEYVRSGVAVTSAIPKNLPQERNTLILKPNAAPQRCWNPQFQNSKLWENQTLQLYNTKPQKPKLKDSQTHKLKTQKLQTPQLKTQ